jgi:hypothetical protein
MSTVGMLA